MRHSQRGLSLIELMVSLALGLIITLGVMNIFLSARNTYTVQNSAAVMQEDARYFLSRISQEVRMVGMFGCVATVTDSSTNLAFTTAYAKPISYDATNKALTLLTSDVGSAGTNPNWTILSDCRSNATAYTGAATPTGSQIAFPLHQVVYTFKNNAIYTGTGTAQQVLISNVQDFGVLFGIASDASGTAVSSYVANPTSPALIRSIRLQLKLTDPSTGTSKLLDQTFSTVASLRNRLP